MNNAATVSLGVATAELHVRLDRLEKVLARPVPAPRCEDLGHDASCWYCRYDELARAQRARRDGKVST